MPWLNKPMCARDTSRGTHVALKTPQYKAPSSFAHFKYHSVPDVRRGGGGLHRPLLRGSATGLSPAKHNPCNQSGVAAALPGSSEPSQWHSLPHHAQTMGLCQLEFWVPLHRVSGVSSMTSCSAPKPAPKPALKPTPKGKHVQLFKMRLEVGKGFYSCVPLVC